MSGRTTSVWALLEDCSGRQQQTLLCQQFHGVGREQWRRLATVDPKIQSSAKYNGARPWRNLKTIMASLNCICYQMGMKTCNREGVISVKQAHRVTAFHITHCNSIHNAAKSNSLRPTKFIAKLVKFLGRWRFTIFQLLQLWPQFVNTGFQISNFLLQTLDTSVIYVIYVTSQCHSYTNRYARFWCFHHECWFIDILATEKHNLQCFDTVGCATGRATGL